METAVQLIRPLTNIAALNRLLDNAERVEPEGATMRLAEDQVRQALQTPDKDVRFAALQYFAKSYSKNPTIMTDVIGLVESLGPKGAFRYSFPISELAQTDESITWAVNRLQRESTAEDEDFVSHIGRLLCRADPILVLPRLLSSPMSDSSPDCHDGGRFLERAIRDASSETAPAMARTPQMA